MSEENNFVFHATITSQEQSNQLVERLFEVAQPETVFSKPTRSGEYTLITASEVMVGVGSGYGLGTYTPGTESLADEAAEEDEALSGGGGGGGGGGFSSGRPVAVVSVGPEGVQVHPVVDRTKLGIAFLSAVGSMLLAFGRMKKN